MIVVETNAYRFFQQSSIFLPMHPSISAFGDSVIDHWTRFETGVGVVLAKRAVHRGLYLDESVRQKSGNGRRISSARRRPHSLLSNRLSRDAFHPLSLFRPARVGGKTCQCHLLNA